MQRHAARAGAQSPKPEAANVPVPSVVEHFVFMKSLVIALLLLAVPVAGQGTQTFTGTITDNECADANHGLMRMGDTDPECVQACIDDHGATYLLYDGKVSYQLSDQKAPVPFAGKKVTVTGTLEQKTKTIRVQSIVAAT